MNVLVPYALAASNAEAFGKAIDPIITHIVNPLVMLLFAIALVVFVYGIFQMVWSDSEDARTRGKFSVLGGVIGMFIMLSAWGLIYIIGNTVLQIGK